jgi:starch synthase (maltosyl-transferring)
MTMIKKHPQFILIAAIAGALALSRDAYEFWLPIDTQVMVDGERRNVAAIENIITGERHGVEWGGIRLRLDPQRDPAIFFRCLA